MDMEKNKIFAAILVAGIAAYIFGFVSDLVFPEHHAEENAYVIDVPENLATGAVASAPKGPEPIAALLASVDPAKGESYARACAACHTFEKGGANGIGPHLWGVVNRDKGSTDFAYSDAMLESKGKWTYDELNHFLYKPKDYVKGTKMNFIGLKKPERRAAVIAYLRTLSDNPAPLPEVAAEPAAAIDAAAPVDTAPATTAH